ncbi:MAG: hypothetical protein AAF513_16015 [Pseudomonadota bacterium]
MSLACWNCGASLDDIPQPISRHAACGACFNEVHCCRMCQHYDPDKTTSCFEDRADTPLQKENANFCDFFKPAHNVCRLERKASNSNARDALDALFANPADPTEPSDEPPGDTAVPTPEEEARRKLDELFK